jgi:predicted Zn-dependent protease with MMP-like domain
MRKGVNEMRVSLNLMLDLAFPVNETLNKELRGCITEALTADAHLTTIIKKLSIGKTKPILSQHEAKQAGGRARANSLSAKQRKAIAKRAALARWGKKLNQEN